ncbi:hypothetical protein [Aromatoleum aromaticum]|uniref:Uncharacterized protein n=1 Tax=Aromatoleum aromaticum (strain DSM 19018 / LMG 30748 / EbN1) TaxID=76114 RepID=Q5NXL9_AROAE|nr:hypothetical protein [Aromatoleum aromaticum]NMG54543.1 hypothetical protein [Aromatoleum aromaticum]CAI10195.1 hypothetical protein ebA7176 [Aromatoleum aromaticum EbN1]
MSSWGAPPRIDPDDDLKAADELLDKANALLHRHKGADLPEPDEFVALDDDELPVLTDIVDPSELERLELAEPRPAAATLEESVPIAASELAEQLVSLDSAISREIENWFATELPQLLSRELDKLADRLRVETLAHLRATLLPALSERISGSLKGGPGSDSGSRTLSRDK